MLCTSSAPSLFMDSGNQPSLCRNILHELPFELRSLCLGVRHKPQLFLCGPSENGQFASICKTHPPLATGSRGHFNGIFTGNRSLLVWEIYYHTVHLLGGGEAIMVWMERCGEHGCRTLSCIENYSGKSDKLNKSKLTGNVNVNKMVLLLVSCWWWSCCFCLAENATTNHRQALQRRAAAGDESVIA